MSSQEIQNLLQTGIRAAQSGNKPIARGIFNQIVELDPSNELAWVWMATVVDTVAERRECLQNALDINPDNERARLALEKLQSLPDDTVTVADPTRTDLRTDVVPAPEGLDLDDSFYQDERSALALPDFTSRRFLFGLATFISLAMIMAGLILLSVEIQNRQAATVTPTSTVDTFALAIPTATAQKIGYITATSPGGTPGTPAPEITPSTWTPSPTWTASPSPLPTATLLPLEEYSLLISRKTPGEITWSLYQTTADGTNLQPLQLNLPEELVDAGLVLIEAFDATWAPDGRHLVFTGRIQENAGATPNEFEELFFAPISGGTVQRITSLRAPQTRGAAWSPDGNQIIFASDADGDYELYTITFVADSFGSPEQITSNTFVDRDPVWSPDSQDIAFTSDRSAPGKLAVWRMTSAGKLPQQLTANHYNSHSPVWSPDGTKLIYLTDQNVFSDIYQMDAQGNSKRPLLIGDIQAEERDPAWSPDGTWIGFSSNRESLTFEAYIVRPDGSGLRRITSESSEVRYSAWQPEP